MSSMISLWNISIKSHRLSRVFQLALFNHPTTDDVSATDIQHRYCHPTSPSSTNNEQAQAKNRKKKNNFFKIKAAWCSWIWLWEFTPAQLYTDVPDPSRKKRWKHQNRLKGYPLTPKEHNLGPTIRSQIAKIQTNIPFKISEIWGEDKPFITRSIHFKDFHKKKERKRSPVLNGFWLA